MYEVIYLEIISSIFSSTFQHKFSKKSKKRAVISRIWSLFLRRHFGPIFNIFNNFQAKLTRRTNEEPRLFLQIIENKLVISLLKKTPLSAGGRKDENKLRLDEPF